MKRSLTAVIIAMAGFAVFAMARLCMYIVYYDFFSALSFTGLLNSFIQGARFDAAVLFIALFPILLMFLLPVKSAVWKHLWMWAAFALFLCCGFFLASDVVYFGYVNRHLANEIYTLGNDLDFVFAIVKSYIPLAIILLFIFAAAGYGWYKLVSVTDKPERYIWLKILAVAIISFVFIRGTFSSKPIGIIDAFHGGSVQGNLILNGIFTTYRYKFNEDITTVSYETEEAFNLTGVDYSLPYPLLKSYDGSDRQFNVVILLFESWSAYYVGALGSKYGVTPNFDNLSREGALFTKHYAPDKRSVDAIQTILTGVMPVLGIASLGFGLEVKLNNNLGSMASNNGFETIFMQSSARRSFYMDSTAKSLGFQQYYGKEDYPLILDYPDPKGSVFGWDYETLNFLNNLLGKTDKKFLVMLFTGTTHIPFAKLPPQFNKYESAARNDEESFLNTLYYSDYSLGVFMENARKEPWFKDTVFIITGDHTLGKFEKQIFPNDFRVPLLIYAPGIAPAEVYDKVTGHIDLFPTIIELSGIKGEAAVFGKSVFDAGSRSAMINEGGRSGYIKDSGWIRIADDLILSSSLKERDKREIMAKELIARQQVIKTLIEQGRWAPPADIRTAVAPENPAK
ncbi:MAG: sulfatase-like hydrolase/transferase [Deferribacteraceae bacterium]|jgi:phosphoglycerol transferase MdoB-like AlkP superfamily enzyme|nr:sulfatase-like hydrolase/transferase [Deferribacteraceae bacterium]